MSPQPPQRKQRRGSIHHVLLRAPEPPLYLNRRPMPERSVQHQCCQGESPGILPSGSRGKEQHCHRLFFSSSWVLAPSAAVAAASAFATSAPTQEPEITWGGLPSPRPPSPRVNWGGAEDRCRYRAIGSATLVLESFGNKWFLLLHPRLVEGASGMAPEPGARGQCLSWLPSAGRGVLGPPEPAGESLLEGFL